MWKLLFAAGAVAWLVLGGKGVPAPPPSSFPSKPSPKPLPPSPADRTKWYVFDKYPEGDAPDLYKVTAKSEQEAMRWMVKKLKRPNAGGLRSGPWHEWDVYPGDPPPKLVKAGKA